MVYEVKMKSKRIRLIALIMLQGLLLMGCATPMGMTASNTPLQGRRIVQNYGKVEAHTTSWILYFPFIIPITEPDIDGSISETLAEKKADALINVHWYEKQYYFGLFGFNRTIIHGAAVKLAN